MGTNYPIKILFCVNNRFYEGDCYILLLTYTTFMILLNLYNFQNMK